MKMREGFVNSRFNQDRNLWLPVVLLLALFSFSATAGEPATKPAVPAATQAKKQTFKPGTPEAAVAVLMEYDYSGKGRADPKTFFAILAPFTPGSGPYVNSSRLMSCGQYAVIRRYRIVGGGNDPNTKDAPEIANRIYFVTVEAEVLALFVNFPRTGPPHQPYTCGWKDLEIVNRRTGQVEQLGDVTLNDASVTSTPYERFGRYVERIGSGNQGWIGRVLAVDPDRRQWRFRIPLVFGESMQMMPFQQNNKIVHESILYPGWVFTDPSLTPHMDIGEKLRQTIEAKQSFLNDMDVCLGKRKPIPDAHKAYPCTPVGLQNYREADEGYRALIDFLRSLQSNPTRSTTRE